MAKLIKSGDSKLSTNQPNDLTQIADMRRTPVIDKETYEARSVAQQIRERAQGQAAEILAQAEDQAHEKLAQAAEQAQIIQQQAQAQGRQEGQQQAAGELAKLLEHLQQRERSIQEEFVPQIADLATAIAEKILARELTLTPTGILDIARRALHDKARQRRDIVLLVHPEDLELMRREQAQLLDGLSRSPSITIQESSKVSRYGMIIETEAGSIDAQLDSQLQVFHQALTLLSS